jgi:putative protease
VIAVSRKGYILTLPIAFGDFVEKKEIGKISHYFSKIGVAVVDLTAELKVGDKISIEGRGQVVEQKVDSMQMEHKNVPVAKKGQSIGMKTVQPVKEGDVVFKVID